jgi:hypothetical protein
MTTGAIIAIVVIALIVIALLAFMVPRMRAKAEVQKRERELNERRERAAEEQRAEASARESRASEAEQRARLAAKEAEAERAQAQLHEERAGLHERGMADHELIDDSERERFADVTNRRDRDDDGIDDRRERNGTGALDDDYERGRHDEAVAENERPARFNRDDVAAENPERRDQPSRY